MIPFRSRFLLSYIQPCQRYFNTSPLDVSNVQTTGTSDRTKTVFWIPHSKGGLIIGKGGSRIDKIRQDVNATYLTIDSKTVKDEAIPVTVYGTSEACTAAIKAIEDIILNHDNGNNLLEMGIAVGKVDYALRKIREIRRKTGTFIHIDKQTLVSSTEAAALVTIKGSKERCAQAKELLQKLITETVKIEVPILKSKEAIVISKKANLQLITDTTIEIHHSEQGDTSLIIHGTNENCDNAKECIEQLILETAESAVLIPGLKFLVLFGKGATRLPDIKKLTGASLILPKDNFGNFKTINSDHDVLVAIRGTAKQSYHAETLIRELLTKISEAEVWVSDQKCSFIMGRDYSRASDIGLKTGAVIRSDQSEAKRGMVPIMIAGSKNECSAAKGIIEQLVEDTIEMKVVVPETKSGLILGTEGSNVAQIERSTGTYINFPRDGDTKKGLLAYLQSDKTKAGFVSITIVGNQDDCTAAKNIIESLVKSTRVPGEGHAEVTTMWIPEIRVAMVIGHNGEVIKGIQHDTDTAVRIDVDAAVSGNVPVKMRGTEEGCDNAMTAIRAILGNMIEIWVPESKVEMIIGRKGANLIKMQANNNACVYIDDSRIEFASPVEGFLPVTIQGSSEACAAVKSTIESIIDNNNPDKQFMLPELEARSILSLKTVRDKITEIEAETGVTFYTDMSFTADGSVCATIQGSDTECSRARETLQQIMDDIPELQMMVPEAKCGMILGASGARVRRIMEETETVILVDSSSSNNGSVSVTIKGGVEECDRARAMIDTLIAGTSTTQIMIDKEKCGFIIGHKGETIKRIQEESGAEVVLDVKSNSTNPIFPITIAGLESEITAARSALKQLFNAPTIEIETKLWLPETTCTFLLEKGSHHLARIMKQTWTRIYMLKEETKDGSVPIKIKGTPEACSAASSAIEQLVASYSDTKIDLWIQVAQRGMIIGKGGAKLKEITLTTGAFIEVSQSIADEGLVPVVLRGSEAACSAARDVIQGLVENDDKFRRPLL